MAHQRRLKAAAGARRRFPGVWRRQTGEELKGPYRAWRLGSALLPTTAVYGIWTKIVFGQIGDGGPGWPVRSRRVHRPPRHELMLTWLTDRIDTNVLEAAEALARRTSW